MTAEARWPLEQLELLGRHMEAENAQRLDDTLATLTSDCVFEDKALGMTFHGRAGAADCYRMWWSGLSPVVSGEQLHLVDERTAIAETTWRGIHTGRFLGIEATGRSVELPMMIVVEIRDGLMATERFYWDRATVLDQITDGAGVR